jgi:hypothetical protein
MSVERDLIIHAESLPSVFESFADVNASQSIEDSINEKRILGNCEGDLPLDTQSDQSIETQIGSVDQHSREIESTNECIVGPQ